MSAALVRKPKPEDYDTLDDYRAAVLQRRELLERVVEHQVGTYADLGKRKDIRPARGAY